MLNLPSIQVNLDHILFEYIILELILYPLMLRQLLISNPILSITLEAYESFKSQSSFLDISFIWSTSPLSELRLNAFDSNYKSESYSNSMHKQTQILIYRCPYLWQFLISVSKLSDIASPLSILSLGCLLSLSSTNTCCATYHLHMYI